MNKNLFIYSFKYLAVLLALVTFSSCERDEFTQQDAWALEQERITFLDNQEKTKLDEASARALADAKARAALEELVRRGMGGTVYYTVSIVPGGSTAFSSGRFEEAQTIGDVAAEVTVSQFGSNNPVDPEGNPNSVDGITQTVSATNGVASFALYGGEATVQITFPNGEYTPVSYVVSLTPDGGVSNGATVHVGNVIPVFEVPGGGADTEETKAVISGMAFAELDITFGNNDEEAVPEGTPVVAYIDVNPAFMDKYINTGFGEEMGNIDGTTTMSGYVQRIAYGRASTRTTVGAPVSTGDNNGPDSSEGFGAPYTLEVAATASGLPIMLKYGEFAANRTYFAAFEDDGDFGPITKRFLYTQATELGGTANPTPINFVGSVDITSTMFDFNETPATGTVTYTKTVSTSAQTGTTTLSSSQQFNIFAGATQGLPTVVLSGPDGSGAAATLVSTPVAGPGIYEPTLQTVTGINVTAGGSGYTGALTATVTPFSFTGRDASGTPNPNGYGTIVNVVSAIGRVEIIDSGFGYTDPAGAGPFSGPGTSTGVNPTAVFNNPGDPLGQTPTGGTPPVASVAVNRQVGVVTEVVITSGGSGYTNPVVTIINGDPTALADGTQSSPTIDGNSASVFFETDGSGGLRFVNGTTTFDPNVADPTGVNLSQPANKYALVPNVNLNATAIEYDGGITNPAVTAVTFPEIEADIDTNGDIVRLRIVNPGSGFADNTVTAAGTRLSGITVNVVPITPRATAVAFTNTGGTVGNYVVIDSPISQDIYNLVAAEGSGDFHYLYAETTALGDQEIYSDGGTLVVDAAGVQVQNPAEFSDYKVEFEGPNASAANPLGDRDNAAYGYPVFDQTSKELVGIYIASQGTGYQDNEEPDYWIIPTGEVTTAATRGDFDLVADYVNSRTFTIPLAPASESFVFTLGTTAGSTYAVRPEVSVSGGTDFSAQELVTLRQGLTGAIRSQLQFNSTGEITGVGSTAGSQTLSLSLGLVPTGTASGTTFDVVLTTDRLEGLFNDEVNGDGDPSFDGFLTFDLGLSPVYIDDLGAETTAFDFFKNGVEPTVDLVSGLTLLDGGTTGASNDSYIVEPTFTVMGLSGVVATGTAVLDNGGDIVDLTLNVVDPDGFFLPTNDPSYSAAGERFRTIGGPSRFDVFSGISYVRDVNYGTGIELE